VATPATSILTDFHSVLNCLHRVDAEVGGGGDRKGSWPGKLVPLASKVSLSGQVKETNIGFRRQDPRDALRYAPSIVYKGGRSV